MSPRAVVTGGSSGIGRAAALELADRGYDLAITYQRDREGAEALAAAAEQRGVRCLPAQLDLADPAGVPGVLEPLLAQLGGIDVLVNNAGANHRATTLEDTEAGFARALDVNLAGPAAVARAAARRMVADGTTGSIVNVTSVLAFEPLSAAGAYGAAKAGLEALTKVMALELAGHGIRVNAVAPGHTATPMNYAADVVAAGPPQQPVIPLGRAAVAAEIVEAIMLLAAGGSYVTGASLLVDGGLSLVSGPDALQRQTGRPPEREGQA